MLEERPIAYFSKVLANKQIGLSAYEKEYMEFLSAVDKYKSYLQGAHFIFKIDHHNLKCWLEQRVTTSLY